MSEDIWHIAGLQYRVIWDKFDCKYFARCLEFPDCTGASINRLSAVVNAVNSVKTYFAYRQHLGLSHPAGYEEHSYAKQAENE